MISFWEKDSLLQYDAIIIGAGIVGLQTAIQIKEKLPHFAVLVLERALLPTGASTRNAGFAATGSLSELVDDAKTQSEAAIVDLFHKRKSGIDFLRHQLGDKNIGYQADGSHELLTDNESDILNHIDHYNHLLKDFAQEPIFNIENSKLKTFGFNSGKYKYCISNATEASLHTGLLIRNLHAKAISCGVEVKTGAAVSHFEEQNNQVKVWVNDAIRSSSFYFSTPQLFVCTNAFSHQFFPDANLQAGRGQVLITKPINNLPIKGIFHADKGYYYFRNVGNRVLLGGGRNLDFKTENTTTIALNDAIQNSLQALLKTHILPNTTFEIDMQWAGIMAFGDSKAPIIQSLSDRVHGGFRLGGMGVALGSMVALELVQKVY